MRTNPLVVNYRFYDQEIRSSWSKRLRPNLPPEVEAEFVKDGTLYEKEVPPIKETRLARQHGGSVRTPSRWIASVAMDLQVEMNPLAGPLFVPPIAIGEELIGIENIDRCPGLDIFPFKHTPGLATNLTTADLWPGMETDWIYEHLSMLIATTKLEYLEKESVAVNDFKKGLIDPGYEAPPTS